MYKKFLLINSLGKEPSKNIKAQSRDAAKGDIKYFIKSKIKKPRGRK